MHGVRREKFCPSSEEQKEAEKKRKQKKLLAFVQGNEKILQKNKESQFDVEGMQLSSKLLCGNPDIYTFWNYRRRALEAKRAVIVSAVSPISFSFEELETSLKELQFDTQSIERISSALSKCSDDSSPGQSVSFRILLKNEKAVLGVISLSESSEEFESKGWKFVREFDSPESLEALYESELALIETALEKNPKSYSAWHQRAWVLQRIQKPDYQKELKLCNMALKMDERNFHCWDHRRLVCSLAEVSLQNELEFTSDKVKENFSNYSAWHYRSREAKRIDYVKLTPVFDTLHSHSLLPRLYPPTLTSLPLSTEMMVSELDLVRNAFFTDPEDQSAWFYSRWLTESKVPNDTAEIPSELREALSSQLADCEELAQEEPKNKWPVLIATLCLRRLNDSNNQYRDRIISNLGNDGE